MNSLYFELTDGSDTLPNNLLTCMLRMRRECNPDFTARYASIVRWYAEVDPVHSQVLREVGLDDKGRPITLGPFRRNDGFWIGMFADSRRAPRIDRATFQNAWSTLEEIYRDRIPPKQIEPRLPIRHRDQLVGVWSASMLEGPFGAMSDQVISFLLDGRGYFEDYNVTLMYYDEFEWQILEPGQISMRGITCFQEDGTSLPSDFQYENVSAETQVHPSGNGKSVTVLYLPLANERQRWVGNAYGRCPVSASSRERPKFST